MTPADIQAELASLRHRVDQLEKAAVMPLDCVRRGLSVRDIVDAAAAEFGVPSEAIFSARRDREIAVPRQVSMMLAMNLLNLSSIAIGRVLRRDHSTVLYAGRYIAERCRNEPDLAMRVQRVRLALLNTSQGATA